MANPREAPRVIPVQDAPVANTVPSRAPASVLTKLDGIGRKTSVPNVATTKPAVMAARGLVFGLLAAFLGIFALVLLIIGATRGLQLAIEPFSDQGRAVYISYFIVGGVLCIVGAVLFKKRNDGADAV